MRKEIVLAIVLGVILGVVIIFGINLANQSTSNPSDIPNNQATPTAQLTPTPTPILQVFTPSNNSVLFSDSITLTGKTLKNAFVAIIWDEGEAIVKADQTGDFSQEISLTGGENVIQLTAADGLDYQESVDILSIYTTAKIETTPEATPTDEEGQEATESATKEYQNLIQRIQDRAKDQKTSSSDDTLKGFSGIINKISDLSLVVNISQNNTLQVITDENTEIVRNSKSIKPASLSIDEKIIIIGNLDTEDILNARRIVAISNTTPTTIRQVVIGSISNLDQEEETFTINEFNIKLPKKSDINVEDLQDGQKVITIIETDIEDQTHTLLSLQSLLQ